MPDPIQRRATPVFSTNFALEAEIKTNKEKPKERESSIRILFIDNKTKFTVGEVILSRLTAIELSNSLKEILDKVDETLKKKNLPKQPEKIESPKDKPTYLG